jgi:hypothetical protein
MDDEDDVPLDPCCAAMPGSMHRTQMFGTADAGAGMTARVSTSAIALPMSLRMVDLVWWVPGSQRALSTCLPSYPALDRYGIMTAVMQAR